MYSTDFEYNGKRLSEFNGLLCNVNGSGSDSISFGTEVTWNTVKIGNTFAKTSASYDTAYTTTLQFAKYSCSDVNDYYFSDSEILYIERWLMQPQYKKFKLIYDDESFSNIYYMATFTNVTPLTMGGKVVGFELNLTTNAPYAYHDEITISSTGVSTLNVRDMSTVQGFIYPVMSITSYGSGELTLTSSCGSKSYVTEITGMSVGEIITFSGPTKQITTNLSSHKLYSNFNYVYPRITNYVDDDGIEQTINTFTSNFKLDYSITYSPAVRAGII